MAVTIYKGLDTYAIAKAETAFAVSSDPAGTDDFGIVQTFTATLVNNIIRVQGIGTGRNATNFVNVGLDVTGTLEFQLNQLDFLRFGIGAKTQGTGTEVDPTELVELDNIGFTASEVPTITLEVGSEGGANDDVLQFLGVAFNTMTINATQGEIVRVSMDWTGQTGVSSTTLEVFAPSSARPFTFVDGSVKLNADVWSEVQSFELVTANNLFVYRSLGSTFIKTPVFGIRRYDFTIVMKKTVDAAGSVLSGIEARELFFGGAGKTTSDDIAQYPDIGDLQLLLSEGASTGDRVIQVDLESVQITSVSEPIDLLGGIIEMTVTGFGLAGLTDASDKVPLRFFTRA